MIKHHNNIYNTLSDFALFLAPALIFNLMYLFKFHGTSNGTLLNIYLVALIWLIVTSFRLLLSLCIPAKKMPAINMMLMGSVWSLLCGFYLLCFLGLIEWGRVPTFMIVKVYLSQIHSIMDALDISLLMLLILACAFLGVLSILYKMVWSKTQWLLLIAHRFHNIVAFIIFLLIGIIGVIEFWQRFYYTEAQFKNEAFLELFFPDLNSKKMQNLRLSSSKVLESEENAARLNYKKSNFEPRNIIVIVVDALRSDHLSINGYARPTTPFITSLNQKGQLRTLLPVRSACAESSCGLITISRSKYPNSFTAVDFSLYEVLRLYGYKTHFFLSGDHTNFYHLKEVFKPYDTYIDGSGLFVKGFSYINDDRVVINELNKMSAYNGTPTYIQFHLMSAHGLGLRVKPDFPYSPSHNYYNAISLAAFEGEDQRRRSAINFYDNGVTQADAMIATIFSILKEKGYLKNALVLITADHGELLGESGLYAHAKTIEDQVLNIPLIVWSSKEDDPAIDFKKWPIVSQTDIAPTILRALNMIIPSTWHGVALQTSPQSRNILVMQGDDVGVYSNLKGVTYKLTLNRNTSTENEWIVTQDALNQPRLIKEDIPAELLKKMRIELYKMDH